MSPPLYRSISHCRLCNCKDLTDILDLGEHALSGRFPSINEPDPPSAPLVLASCSQCGLLQLRHTVAMKEMYTYDYGYRSGTNATMRNHLAAIVEWVSQRCSLKAEDMVVDIGCNDGTLLKAYRTPGLQCVGVDAIAGKFRSEYPPELRAIEGFFTSSMVADQFSGRQAKAITSIAMFYDLEDPNDFVRGIAAMLAVDGIWVMEQSYLGTMLETNSFDTICHEHLEYYGLEQIERLMENHRLRVFDVEKNPTNGGSFRIAICRADSAIAERPTVAAFRESEQGLHLRARKTYDAFKSRITRIREDLRDLMIKEIQKGKKIYAYGASTKGNTLLQYCGLDRTYIVAAADRNPEKWDHRTPLTGIPIVSEEIARRAEPDYFLVLPWHFHDEFLAREKAFLERGGKFIFPLPTIEIV